MRKIKINRKETLTNADITKMKKDNKNINLSINPFETKTLEEIKKNRVWKQLMAIPVIIALIWLACMVVWYQTSADIEEESLEALNMLIDWEITFEEFDIAMSEEVKDEEVEEILEEILTPLEEETFEDKLFEFISTWEWKFQPKAFCDSYYRKNGKLIRETWKYCDRWSIGFWTKSYWGEEITLEEWIKRRNEDIRHRNSLITSDCLTDNQRIATVDFMYQHWNNSSNVKNYANQCNTNAIYNQIVWWRDVYKGKILVNWKNLKSDWLAKREQTRVNLFNQ